MSPLRVKAAAVLRPFSFGSILGLVQAEGLEPVKSRNFLRITFEGLVP